MRVPKTNNFRLNSFLRDIHFMCIRYGVTTSLASVLICIYERQRVFYSFWMGDRSAADLYLFCENGVKKVTWNVNSTRFKWPFLKDGLVVLYTTLFDSLLLAIPNAPGAIETVSYSCSREKTSKFDINDMDIAMNGCDLPVPNDGL